MSQISGPHIATSSPARSLARRFHPPLANGPEINRVPVGRSVGRSIRRCRFDIRTRWLLLPAAMPSSFTPGADGRTHVFHFLDRTMCSKSARPSVSTKKSGSSWRNKWERFAADREQQCALSLSLSLVPHLLSLSLRRSTIMTVIIIFPQSSFPSFLPSAPSERRAFGLEAATPTQDRNFEAEAKKVFKATFFCTLHDRALARLAYLCSHRGADRLRHHQRSGQLLSPSCTALPANGATTCSQMLRVAKYAFIIALQMAYVDALCTFVQFVNCS